jgi:DNA-binding NtrC family response regulator
MEMPLRTLTEVITGPPERSAWRGIDEPDLVVLVPGDAPPGDISEIERLLEFLSGIQRSRRPPVPVLYVAPAGARPSPEWVGELIDDRASAELSWPPDPDVLVQRAADLIDAPVRPPSLRERTRLAWVRRRVERLYAGIDLPSLRQAIDPRNAGRPVLLVGERGTGRALLARYIHQLAEPTRNRFVRLALDTVRPGELEETVLGRTAGDYATLYLHGLARVPRGTQEDLAELLIEGGGAALETVRWIAAAEQLSTLVPALRLAPWLRVDLPPLRSRPDLDALAEALTQEPAERAGRRISISPEALEALRAYPWPGNLRELDAVLAASLTSSTAEVLGADDLRFDAAFPGPADERSAAEAVQAETPEHPDPPEAEEPESGPEADEPIPEPLEAPPEIQVPAEADSSEPEPEEGRGGATDVRIVPPLAEEIRAPVLALRTYAGLLNQRPDDPTVRRRLSSLLEGDLRRIEEVLERAQRFCTFGRPEPKTLDLPGLLSGTLQRRLSIIRERRLVMLEELDREAPPAEVDEEQLRFALDAILDRALHMVPQGGDLYLGSRHLEATDEQPARHRILIRFHSPEDVLVPPDEAAAGGVPLEILLARSLVERLGGSLAVDVSGPQDNLVLIEIPA